MNSIKQWSVEGKRDVGHKNHLGRERFLDWNPPKKQVGFEPQILWISYDDSLARPTSAWSNWGLNVSSALLNDYKVNKKKCCVYSTWCYGTTWASCPGEKCKLIMAISPCNDTDEVRFTCVSWFFRTEHPSYVHDDHFILQIWTSKGKYSTEIMQLDLKMPCESQITVPSEMTITFVLMMALL